MELYSTSDCLRMETLSRAPKDLTIWMSVAAPFHQSDYWTDRLLFKKGELANSTKELCVL